VREDAAREDRRAAAAPWVEADALVTLGAISERSGKIEAAAEQPPTAHEQAVEAQVLGRAVAASSSLPGGSFEQGDLTAAAAGAHEGTRPPRARSGRSPSTASTAVHPLPRALLDGRWDHAQADRRRGRRCGSANPGEARCPRCAFLWRARLAIGRGAGGAGS